MESAATPSTQTMPTLSHPARNQHRSGLLKHASDRKKPNKTGGEGGIRTLGTGYPVRQISNLVPSTTRPPLRARERERRLFNIDRERASRSHHVRRPRPSMMRRGPLRQSEADESVEQVELVLGIVDEVDAACAGHHGEPE